MSEEPDLFDDIIDELNSALKNYPPMNSAHEGYAVILEELDELWDIVKRKPGTRDKTGMYNEAKQVAAMAMRFIIDVCGAWDEEKEDVNAS